MTTLVAALRDVELPREVDTEATGIAILLELRTDIDATVCSHLRIAGMEDVVGKDGYTEAFVFEKLAAQSEVYSTCSLRLRAT